MLAYYRSGRQADALRAFGRLRSALAEELGLRPSAELAALEQKVLLQSPELDHRPFAAEAPRGWAPVPLSGALPRPASSFVGRVEEVAEVAKLVGERRLVTLAGAGGCGKTRLAQEVAASMAALFSEGAHFVALAPLPTHRQFRSLWPRPSAYGPSPVVQLPKWWQKWSATARPSPCCRQLRAPCRRRR